jgi:hypothetical protein
VSCGRKRSPLLHDFDEDHETTPFMLITDNFFITGKSTVVNPFHAIFFPINLLIGISPYSSPAALL